MRTDLGIHIDQPAVIDPIVGWYARPDDVGIKACNEGF
jgi:hypothetical protein